MSISLRMVPAVCLVHILSMANISSAASSTIFASGDNTPAYYAADGDNNVFFKNILQGGAGVLVHETSTPWIGENLNAYYNSLPGVSSSFTGGAAITSGLLSGVDLLVTGLYGGPLAPGEISAIQGLLDSGGSVFLMGDYTAEPTAINGALAALGSDMLLYGEIVDPGDWYATGSRIAADPFTAGVSSLRYGATYGVSGGTPLFFDSTGRAFIAYEGGTGPAVPAPGAILLGTLGAGLVGWMRRCKTL